MTHKYQAMEAALDVAVARNPVEIGTKLIARAEDIILKDEDPTAFEKELLVLAGTFVNQKPSLFEPRKIDTSEYETDLLKNAA